MMCVCVCVLCTQSKHDCTQWLSTMWKKVYEPNKSTRFNDLARASEFWQTGNAQTRTYTVRKNKDKKQETQHEMIS